MHAFSYVYAFNALIDMCIVCGTGTPSRDSSLQLVRGVTSARPSKLRTGPSWRPTASMRRMPPHSSSWTWIAVGTCHSACGHPHSAESLLKVKSESADGEKDLKRLTLCASAWPHHGRRTSAPPQACRTNSDDDSQSSDTNIGPACWKKLLYVVWACEKWMASSSLLLSPPSAAHSGRSPLDQVAGFDRSRACAAYACACTCSGYVHSAYRLAACTTCMWELPPPCTRSIRVVSALRLRSRVFTEWALDRI